ncbi:hypothetical protein JCM6882_007219 [Rhodosporidiobolus microsporus]
MLRDIRQLEGDWRIGLDALSQCGTTKIDWLGKEGWPKTIYAWKEGEDFFSTMIDRDRMAVYGDSTWTCTYPVNTSIAFSVVSVANTSASASTPFFTVGPGSDDCLTSTATMTATDAVPVTWTADPTSTVTNSASATASGSVSAAATRAGEDNGGTSVIGLTGGFGGAVVLLLATAAIVAL